MKCSFLASYPMTPDYIIFAKYFLERGSEQKRRTIILHDYWKWILIISQTLNSHFPEIICTITMCCRGNYAL